MSRTRELHQDAMRCAAEADASRLRGDDASWSRLIHEAFEREKEAAMLIVDRHELEPTRSILLKSAAVLALENNLSDEASHLVALALQGSPPGDLRGELEELCLTAAQPGVRKPQLDPQAA